MRDVNNFLGFPAKTPQRSIIKVQDAEIPSVNSSCRTWANIIQNEGTDLVYQKDAVFGDRIVVKTSGLYIITIMEVKSTATVFGVSVDGDPTVTLDSLPLSNVIIEVLGDANTTCGGCVPAFLNAGDVLRCQVVGNGIGANVRTQIWVVAKVPMS